MDRHRASTGTTEIAVPMDDRGLAYGDGLFETLRVREGRALRLNDHLARLHRDCQRLNIPLSRHASRQAAERALEEHARAGDWVLKLMVTRGSGGRGYRPPAGATVRVLASAHDVPPAPDPMGVSVVVSSWHLLVNPQLAGLKSLNRLEQVMASADIPEHAFEALMTSPDGDLLEGTRCNLFVRLAGEWVTPPADRIAVAGVMRGRLMAYLRHTGERVTEKPIPREALNEGRVEAMLLSNSVIGVVPVRNLDGQRLPVDEGLATIPAQSHSMELFV